MTADHEARNGVDTAPLRAMDIAGATKAVARYSDMEAARILVALGPRLAAQIISRLPEHRRQAIATEAAAGQGDAWLHAQRYPEDSVGRLVHRPQAVFRPETHVGDAIDVLREAIRGQVVHYVWVTSRDNRLLGVVAFRELLFADRDASLGDIMITAPFALDPDMSLVDAMHEVVLRHYPSYPVCTRDGVFLGSVRGQSLFEAQAFAISAQAGAMVGVEREERLATPWLRSLRFRHPWLQVNLLTAFVAASVVGLFQDLIDAMVLLAVFLPVLSGQCSNTGCQTLAVTLRGMALGELPRRHESRLILREALMGLTNGMLVGMVAAAAMYAFAQWQGHASPPMLAVVTWLAMTASCAISGMAGAAVPIGLRRWGADPAQASSIFLTTAADAVAIGLFLGLAMLLVPMP
ncbi:MAG TPA: magnesium transporter [Xanthomonadaceae bacterium]|nr:magnesium transporter [Xanthomonadaceae bacterium]